MVLGNNLSLGNVGTVTLIAGMLLAGNPNITLANPLVFGSAGAATVTLGGTTTGGAINALTFSGTVTLNNGAANTTTLTVNKTTTFSTATAIAGSGNFTLAASIGTLILNAGFNASTYAGTVTLNTAANGSLGTLSLLGASATLGGGTLVLNAGVLNNASAGSLTLTNPSVTLNTSAVATVGVAFTGAALTLSGAVSVAGNSVLQVKNTTTLSGLVSGNNTLTLSGTPIVSGSATVASSGNLILTNADSSTSTVTINGGTLTLSGGGKLTAVAGITLNANGTLAVQTSATNFSNPINTAATLTLAGGTLNFQGAANVAAAQSLGATTLNAGNSTIILSNGGGTGTAVLTLASLVNNIAGGTLNIQAGQTASLQTLTAAGSDQVVVTGAISSTASNSVLPRVTVTDSQTVTVGATSGITSNFKLANTSGANIIALTTYAAFVPGGGGTGTLNYGITSASNTYTSGVTADAVNSILFIGDGETISGGTSLMTLTVASGTIASTRGGLSTNLGNTISVANLAFGATEGKLITNDGALTISSIISGAAGLTMTGPGQLTLSSANSYAGPSAFNSGTLILGNGAALNAVAGTTFTISGGTLQTTVSAGYLFPSAVFNNANITLGGANPLLFGGTVVLNGTTNTLTVNTSLAALDGTISQAAGTVANLIKAGAGTLAIAGGTNSFTGWTFVNGGIVQVQNTGTILGGTRAFVSSGAAVQILGSGLNTISTPLVLNGAGPSGTGALENLIGGNNTYTGIVTLNTSSSIGADNATTLTLTGGIGGFGDLNKVGVGTLAINAAAVANQFTGATNVNAGIVSYNNATSLGLITGPVVVAGGATLQTVASVNGKQLIVSGTGFGNAGGQLGALPQGAVIATGNTTWNGNIVLANGAVLAAASGDTLTVNGTVSSSDATGLTKFGMGAVQLNGNNTFLGNVAVVGGTLVLANSNAYAGSTTVSAVAINSGFTAGQLTFTGLGAALNSSSFTINQSGTLLIDNSAGAGIAGAFNSSNRISAAAPITLNTATFQFNALNVAGASSSETFGAITLSGGQSQITAGYTAVFVPLVTSTVTFASLTRNTDATVNFTSNSTAVNTLPLGGPAVATSYNRILFTNAASVTGLLQGNLGGILPFAEVQSGAVIANGFDFASYNQGPTLNLGITAYTGYVTNLNAANPGDIVMVLNTTLVANITLVANSNQTIGALLIYTSGTFAAGTVTVNPTGTLTLSAGALLGTGAGASALSTTVNVGTLNLIGETDVFANQSQTTINSIIAGAGTLVSGGNNTLSLGGTNPYTGGTVMNAGTLAGNNTNLGLGAITLNGGSFNPSGNIANTVNLNGVFTFGTGVSLLGNVVLTSNAGVLLNGNMTIQGVVSESGGSHALTVVGGGSTLVLNNVNTYTGGTIFDGGNLQLGNNNALGAGVFTLVNGALNNNVAVVLPNTMVFATSTITINSNISQGNNLTFAGAVTLIGNNTFNISNNGTNNGPGLITFTGGISGSGGFNVVGNGILQLPTANTFSGGFTMTGQTTNSTPASIVGGLTVIAGNSNALGTSTIIFGPAGALLATAAAHVQQHAAVQHRRRSRRRRHHHRPAADHVHRPDGPADPHHLDDQQHGDDNAGDHRRKRWAAPAGPSRHRDAGARPAAGYFSGGLTLNPLTGPGIAGTYYDFTGSTNGQYLNYTGSPVFTRLDPAVNILPQTAPPYTTLENNLGAFANPVPTGVTATDDAVSWNGYLNVINGGLYTFFFQSDDQADLFIDGAQVVQPNVTEASASVVLTPGLHSFRDLYVEGGGDLQNVVDYSGPDTGGSDTLIPTALSPSSPGLVSFAPTATTLVLGGAGVLGSGTATLNGGVVQAATPLTLSNAVNFAGTPFMPLALAGSNMTLSGAISLANSVGLSINNTTTFAGSVSGANVTTGTTNTTNTTVTGLTSTANLAVGLQVLGAGIPAGTTIASIVSATSITLSAQPTANATVPLTFTTINNTQTGTTTLNSQSITNLTSTAGLAVGMLVFGAGILPGETISTITSATAITLTGYATASAAGVPLTFAATNNIVVTGTTNATTSITGLPTTANLAVGMVVSGTGITGAPTITAINSSTSITISAAATVSATEAIYFTPISSLNPSNIVATGTTNSNTSIVLSVANNNPTTASLAVGMTVTGAGIPGGTTITAINAGTNTITISQAATTAATEALVFTPQNGLTLSNTPVIAGSTTYTGGGNLILSAANPSYTGATIVNAGTLTLNGSATLANTQGITLNPGGTLTVDNTLVNVPSRLNAAAPLNLNGGTLTYLGNLAAGATSTDSLGAVTLGSGNSTIAIVKGTGAGATAKLTFASLTNTVVGGMLNLQAGNFQAIQTQAGTLAINQQTLDTSTDQIVFTAAPTSGLVGNIYPHITVSGAAAAVFVNGTAGPSIGYNLATASGTNVVSFGATAANTYKSLLAGGTNAATDNVLITSAGTTTLTANDTINSLLLVGDSINVNANAATVTLTVSPGTSAGMIVSSGGTTNGNAISVPFLALGATEGLVNVNSGALSINSVMTGSSTSAAGAGAFTSSGGGTLTLGAANTYTGATTLASGTLTLGAFNAIPTGSAVTLLAGTVQVGGTVPAGTLYTIPNAVLTFNNSVVTFTGPNPLLFTGAVTLIGTNNALTVAGTTTGIAGVVSFSGTNSGTLTKLGTGTLYLASPTADIASSSVAADITASGVTTIAQGILNVQNGLALGASTVVANGASLQIQSTAGVVLSRPLVLNGSGVSGRGALESVFGANSLGNNLANTDYAAAAIGSSNQIIYLNTASTIGVDAGTLTQVAPGNTAVTNNIAGPGDLTKVGGGTLTLNGLNSFTGQFNINNGIVIIATNAYAVGSLTGAIVVNAGATLQSNAANTFQAKTLILNGTGFASANLAGAFVVAGNTNQQGNIVLNQGASIGVGAGFTFTVLGTISGAADLVKVGTGTMTLQANNTYTGNTYVDQGTLTFDNAGSALNSGTGAASPGFVVNPGAALILDNNQGNQTNVATRISPTANVTLNGGSFDVIGNDGAGLVGVASTATIGTLVLNSGNSTIQTVSGLNAAAAPLALPTVNLSVNNLVRKSGATANFLGTVNTAGAGGAPGLAGTPNLDSSVNRIVFPSSTISSFLIGNNGGILPFAMANTGSTLNADFATYDFINGSIAPFDGYTSSLTSVNPNGGDIVEVNGTQIITSNTTVTALVLNGGASVVLDGATLDLGGLGGGTGRAILGANGNNTIIGGVLNVGSEGIILSGTGSTVTVNTTLTGGSAGGGLTLSAAGAISGGTVVNLPNPNNYSGNTYLAGTAANYTVNIASNTSFSSGTIYFNAGTLQAQAMVTLANNFQFNASNVTIGNANNNLVFTGNGTIGNTASTVATSPLNTFFSTLTVNSAALTVFSGILGGALTGPGALLVAGTGVLMLSGTNTFSGGLYQSAGTLIAASDSALGTGVLGVGGGTLVADATTPAGRNLANSALAVNGNENFNAGNLDGNAAGASSANGTFTFGSSIPVTLATNTTLTVNTGLTLNGTLGGPGTLTLAGLSATVGQGNLVLGGNNSGYTAGMNLGGASSGSLGALEKVTLGNANALGVGTLTLTNVELANNNVGAIVLGMPVVATGGIVKFSGNNNAANTITFRNALPAGNTLPNAALTFIVSTPTTFDAIMSGGGASATLTMLADNAGSGASTLTFSQADPFTTIAANSVNIAAGQLQLTGLGTLTATGYNIDAGATLTLNNTGNQLGFNPVRMPTGSTITFNGGTLQALGSSAAFASSIETLNGTVTFASGNSTVINVNGNVAGGAPPRS